jgi:hypothetical protein
VFYLFGGIDETTVKRDKLLEEICAISDVKEGCTSPTSKTEEGEAGGDAGGEAGGDASQVQHRTNEDEHSSVMMSLGSYAPALTIEEVSKTFKSFNSNHLNRIQMRNDLIKQSSDVQ